MAASHTTAAPAGLERPDLVIGAPTFRSITEKVSGIVRFMLLKTHPILEIYASPINIDPVGTQTLKDALEGPERQIIREVLQQHNWNRHATAEALGINRTTLYKKMKRLGLEEPHLAASR